MHDRARFRGFAAGAGASAAVVVAVCAVLVAVQGSLVHDRATTARPTAPIPTASIETGAVQRTVSGDVAVATDVASGVIGAETDGARVFTRDGAAAGAQLASGQVVTTIDERPTILIRSDVPFFRALALGSRGRDVAALQRGLEALGYGLAEDREATYGAGTARAVFFLYRDRAHQPVDERGAVVDAAAATTTAVPPGELFAAPSLPMVAVDQCGTTGGVVGDQACALRSAKGSLRITVAPRDADAVQPGQHVAVRTDDGVEFPAAIGHRLQEDSAPPGDDAEGAESDVAHPGDDPGSDAPDAVSFVLDAADQPAPQLSGTGSIVLAAAPDSSLRVPEIAIRRAGDAAWLVASSGRKLPVRVGLCASGLCVVEGDGIADGRRVRLPHVPE